MKSVTIPKALAVNSMTVYETTIGTMTETEPPLGHFRDEMVTDVAMALSHSGAQLLHVLAGLSFSQV